MRSDGTPNMQPITPACLDAVDTGESSTPLDASQIPPTTAQPTTTKKPRAPRKTPQWPPPANLRGAKTPAASQQSDPYDLLYAALPPHQSQSMVANTCIPGFCLPLESPARLSDWLSPHIATHATPSVLKLVLLLQPTYLPGFVFSWMSLISHRLFMPKLLPSKNREVGSGPVD
ncbi:hypothetical protein BD311DRAFT_803906 [Dichomitus squalens]|uniref:CCR4-Not complex component Not1 C-terminal domain-containing protein n=1 Tax=Dichomitus squalens TaxID=114155 RepID=A0A4Q9MXS2_9APHY|nr:hypothetical protein BD311DRAFT_803906 [Dichomitus squalens]